MKSPLSHRKIRNLSALDWFCLRAIAYYQRYISPRKGWRCAYARLHGGGGCSGFASDAIAQHGLRGATPRIKARFADCKWAGQQLKEQQTGEFDAIGALPNEPNAQRNKSCFAPENLDCSACYFLDLVDALVKCGPGDDGCCDSHDCNCSPCD